MRAGMFGFRKERLGALMIGFVACVQGQIMWQTTHTKNVGGGYSSGNCRLVSASLRVKVHPAFLDVEEDVEIGTVGSVAVGNDGNSLEIVGNISLPAGAAIVGALLWDGDAILEGKLLDRNIADSLYEELVDRNSTPPVRPRDPLILEKTGAGSYRFRIYPVALGFARHMRLRYQLPPVIGAEGVRMPFKAAVTSLFANSTPMQVPVTLEDGGGAPKGIFTLPNGTRAEMTFPRTRLLTAAELGVTGNGWDVWGNLVEVAGIGIQPVVPLRQAAVKTSFPEGQMAGNYLSLYATVSQDVLKGLNIRSIGSLAVVVRNGKRSYDIPVACEGGLALDCGSMSFHGKSDSAWSDTLDWEAYDTGGKLLARARVKSSVFQAAKDTGAAVLWASAPSRFSEKKELPAGPVFGFVDEWASLLSLPKDSVGPQLFAFYNENGVPRISNASLKDVIPNYAPDQVPNPNVPGVPVNPNNPTMVLHAKLGSFTEPASWRVERSAAGFIVRIPGLADGMAAVVEMYDLTGKPFGNWAPRSQGGALTLSSAAVRPGVYLVKIRIAGMQAVKRIAF